MSSALYATSREKYEVRARELNPPLSHHKAKGCHYPSPDTLAEAFLGIPLGQKYVTNRTPCGVSRHRIKCFAFTMECRTSQ